MNSERTLGLEASSFADRSNSDADLGGEGSLEASFSIAADAFAEAASWRRAILTGVGEADGGADVEGLGFGAGEGDGVKSAMG